MKSSSKTDMLRSMLSPSTALVERDSTAFDTTPAPTGDHAGPTQVARISRRKRGGSDEPVAAKTARTARLFLHREVGALVRAAKLMNDTVKRLQKSARLCNDDTKAVIDTVQRAVIASADTVTNEHINALIAIRATEWKRTAGSKVERTSTEMVVGSLVKIRDKFAADFEGTQFTESSNVLRVERLGKNVVVTVLSTDTDSTGKTIETFAGRLIVARRMLALV